MLAGGSVEQTAIDLDVDEPGQEFGKQALAVLTVSDLLFDTAAKMTSDERETRFAGALRLALAAAHS